jgi:diguanylate cyclase (GGDEF)-like protein/PAS domain S-box-containing protein
VVLLVSRNGIDRILTLVAFRRTRLPAYLALLVVVTAWVFAERQNADVYRQNLRAEVLSQVSLIRAKLEGHINGNIQLVRGLIATISTEPDMDQERFATLASKLLREAPQVSHIAAAPDLVVRLIYPLQGNESAIGLDYNLHEQQREAALRARDTGQMVLAGPVQLVQGGRGFIARFPVFTTQDRQERFWGIVSAIVDVEQLYRDSGLLDDELSIDIALFGRDAMGDSGERFYGEEIGIADDPVLVDVVLPSGRWQLAAVPRGGWYETPSNIWPLRLLLLLAGALVVVPTVTTGRLIEERQRHIRELTRRELQLARLSRRLGLALDVSQVGVWEMNIENRELFWDERMCELYGYGSESGPQDYEAWARRLHPDDRERAAQEFRVAIETRGRYESHYRLVLENGEVRHIRALGIVYRDPGSPERIVGVNWDVTADVRLNEEIKAATQAAEARNAELEAARQRIEYNALHDSLTGLPNRRYLDEVLADHAEKFARGVETAALLQIDLDRFKQINDTLGHAAGDAMLIHASKALRATVGKSDFVARVGGDEFVIVRRRQRGYDDDGPRRLSQLADRIISEMQRPVVHEGHECRVGVSIGIASDMDTVADPMRLLVNADIALYRAKARGRNQYQFFNEALQAEIITTKRVADEILSGLEQNQFVAYYQPQFSADTLEIVGVEALARWRHPTEGLLGPGAFMTIAEELNVVAAIDRIVLEQTLADLERWKQEGVHIPKASVNVSARRLHDEQLIESLRQMNIRPGTISFELVESIFLDENDELITWNVEQIKELGIDVEIDDFGTGYASIVSLMKLKPSRLKIDRQLVMPIVRSAAQRQLVGSIIDIGKSLGISVLAEGVETMAHAQLLRKLECDALQGYAFARPMGADALARFVREQRWADAS